MANSYLGTKEPKGNVGVRGVVDAGELSVFTQGILSGFAAASAASFTLQIGGVSGTQDVAVAKNTAGESTLLVGTAGQSLPFIIGGAPSTPGQSRTDAIVAYKDSTLTASSNNGIDTVDYKVIAGTAATTGTQTPPSLSTIRAGITNGSLAFVAVLGYVTIAQGASSVTTANYTPLYAMNLAAPKPLAGLTERGFITPFEGLEVFRKDINRLDLYAGGDWRSMFDWDILANIPASGSSTTISSGTFAERDLLQVWLEVNVGAGGSDTIDGFLRFNNDSTTSYARRYQLDGAADVTAASQTALLATLGQTPGWSLMAHHLIINPTTRRKRVFQTCFDTGVAATAPPHYLLQVGGYINVLNKITRIDFLNTGAFGVGNPAATSRMIIAGANY